MSQPLPEFLDYRRAADVGAVLDGRVPLSRLERLRPLLADADGEADYRLEFSRDEAGRAVVRGAVHATLILRCERCLGPLQRRVDSTVALALIAGLDEAGRLPDHYDPLIPDEERGRPLDLIEDELLLALPQIPMHDGSDCPVRLPEPERESAASPFAVLADWREKR